MATSILISGWHPSPNERGTADIIWSCASTVTLCLWTMLHLNLPGPNERYWTGFWRKARWLLLGILAPEVPMLIACGQWSSAQRSVQEMTELGYSSEQWSLAHAFFADSGGILLQWNEEEIFPITAKQVAWLLRKKCIALPKISRRDIMDKSKADTFTKVLALLQTAWLLIQIIGRAGTNLPVTPLELTSAAIALTALTTLWFWLHKPLDAQTPYLIELINLPETADTEFEHESKPKDENCCIPTRLALEHIELDVYMSRKWSERLLSWICRAGLQKPCLDRIPNDRDPQVLGLKQHIMLGIVTASFASIHFVDWHFHFATSIEQWIWRGNCLLMWILLAIYGTAEVVICSREGYSKMGLDTAGGYKRRFPACLWFFIPGGMYFVARLLLLGSALAGLRTLPEEAFQVIQWTQLIPHI